MDQVLCGMSSHLATSSLDRLASWFDSTSGRRLLEEQAPVISECARRFHGDTLLWAGCHTDLTDTVRGCMVRNRFRLETCSIDAPVETPEDANDGAEADPGRFRADLHELPLRNKSLDAAVLHHVLETSADPRSAMREVARALAPGGRLLIVAFNPWSLWGLRSAYARFFSDSFSGLRFVSPGRLQDWLAVLGFELQDEVKYLAYELPFQTRNKEAGVWRRLRNLCAKRRIPLGGVYVISAVKQVSAMRPDWSRTPVAGRKLVPAAYPKLSARIAHFPGAFSGPSKANGDGAEDAG
ncbi:MAG: SAM-dependent methyltransferase [Gammaproteobacteria bacterium]|jgi:SAM-dependent methyltransferase|nr:MAG: SAM-dependent methyltransferase [Gammaproteobacteria bacterium]